MQLSFFIPILGYEDKAGDYFEEILSVLNGFGIFAFVSYPNIDAGNKKIVKIIEKYSNNTGFAFYKNMTRTHFINLMRHALFMIGNSSAGIVEAPIIPLGVINVGSRQRGDMQPKMLSLSNRIVNKSRKQSRRYQVMSLENN